MILKYFSTTELNFSKSWENGLKKIQNLNRFEKYMTIFWLIGPFIYLIERDPADFWLSSIGLVFLVRSIFKKNWSWARQKWFKLALLLWLYSLIISLTSNYIIHSFFESFFWIRFPIYVVAAQAWLAQDRDIRVIMFLSVCLGMLIMCMILTFELILIGQTNGRLTWPYGDTIPGGYISKVCLPILCCFSAIITSRFNRLSLGFFFLLITIITFTLLTGERISFLLCLCGSLLAGLVWRTRWKIYSIFLIFKIAIILIIVTFNPQILNRFVFQFYNSIPLLMDDNSGHWNSWRSGIHQSIETPIFGIGPGNHRINCTKLAKNEPSWLPGKNECNNHAHNFYIQLFSEIGFFGFIIGSLMFYNIVLICFKNRKTNLACPMVATSFVIPFALFFPLQQFGNFYGQWGNLFLWFGIGFSISHYQGWDKSTFKRNLS